MRLLIFKVNQLGDNVVYLPVVQWLCRSLPDAEITVMTSPVAAPLYERATPQVRVLTHPTSEFNSSWRHPRVFLRLVREVRALRPDACLLADDQANAAVLLARLSGARIRVSGKLPHQKLNSLLTHRAPITFSDPAALQNWHIVAHLLEALDLPRANMPAYPPAPDMSAFVTPDAGRKPFVLIHPGAARAYSRWPAERYVELANRLCRDLEVRYVLQGDPAEQTLDGRVHGTKPDSLAEFIGLVGQAALFVGNNSGPMHVASVMGIPSVAFRGPAAPQWMPMWNLEKFTIISDAGLACQPCDAITGPVNRCLNTAEPMACMNRWSVDAVHRIVLERLGRIMTAA
jgi:ADP-heptose:LPS heptosyltransferase